MQGRALTVRAFEISVYDVLRRIDVKVVHSVGDLLGVLNENVGIETGLSLSQQLAQRTAARVLHH